MLIIKGNNSVEKFGKISCVSRNTAYTKSINLFSGYKMETKFCHQSRTITQLKNNEIQFAIVLTYMLSIYNALTKFYQNQSIGPPDIEHKRNFDINQGP